MSPEAIILMVVTIMIIWGGLVVSVVMFRESVRNGDEGTNPDPDSLEQLDSPSN